MNKGLTKVSEIIEEISMGPFGSDIKVDNFVESGVPVLNGANLPNLNFWKKSLDTLLQIKLKHLERQLLNVVI